MSASACIPSVWFCFTVVCASMAAPAVFVLCLSDNAACSGQDAADDVDNVLGSSSWIMSYMERLECTAEDVDEVDALASMSDCDSSADSVMKQRKRHSSALLKKEQKQSSASSDVFIKVRILF